MEAKQSETSIIADLTAKKNLWLKSSRWWMITHWLFSISAAVLSTLAAATNVVEDTAPYYSVGAALCVGIIGVANPQKQSNQNLKGYLLMEDGLFHYSTSLIDISQLLEIYGRAEAAVHDNLQQPPQTSPTKPTPVSKPANSALTA